MTSEEACPQTNTESQHLSGAITNTFRSIWIRLNPQQRNELINNLGIELPIDVNKSYSELDDVEKYTMIKFLFEVS